MANVHNVSTYDILDNCCKLLNDDNLVLVYLHNFNDRFQIYNFATNKGLSYYDYKFDNINPNSILLMKNANYNDSKGTLNISKWNILIFNKKYIKIDNNL